jgi:hypoxanthine phosphoribosyltransferase
MVKKATIDGIFKIKKIIPRFRKYILNFLKIDITNRRLLNKLVNGKVIVVDDITSEGTTFKEIKRLVENYAPKEIILFSLIG